MTPSCSKSLLKALYHFIVSVLTLNIATVVTSWKRRNTSSEPKTQLLGVCGEDGQVSEVRRSGD